MGDAPGALEDLNKSAELSPNYTQTWVKKASVHMELCMRPSYLLVVSRLISLILDTAQADAAFEDFQVAERIDANDPDMCVTSY